MLKLRKLISLVCAVCVTATGTIVTGLTGTTASAAAADAASCINTNKSYAPTSMGTTTNATKSKFAAAASAGTGAAASGAHIGDKETGNPVSYSYAGATGSDSTTRALSRIALRSAGYNGKYNSAEVKILHVGWTMTNNAGTVIDLMYTYDDAESGSAFTVWDPTDTDSSGNMLLKSGGNNYEYKAYVNPRSYHADWFVDCEEGKYRLYIDNIFFAEGSLAGGDHILKNLYFRVPVNTTYDYTVSDQVYMTYIPTTVGGETVTPTMDDVVAYTLTKDTSRGYWWPTSCRNDGYYWQSTGIGDIGGTAGKRLVGNTSGIKGGSGVVSGANYIVKPPASTASDAYGGVGYRLRTLAANGDNTTKGCLPPDAVNDNVIVQSVTITPDLTSGNSGAIGFRGNNSMQIAKFTFDASKGYVSGQAYDFTVIVNNKDKRYYIIVDGKQRGAGSTGESYLSEIIYSVGKSDTDSLTLSNMMTTSYDYTVSISDKLSELAETATAPFSTNSDGYGDFEPENYSTCYDSSTWKLVEHNMYSNGKALGVIAENKTAPGAYESPTLNLSFTANRSGENTYYLWIRHRASVAKEDGKNCYLSLSEYGSYSTFTFSAERYAMDWICLGSVTASQGETGYVRIRHRQQNYIAIDRYVITADPSFVPTDAYYNISPANSSTAKSIAASSFSNGRVCFQAESMTYNSPYSKYSMFSHYSTYGSSSNFASSDGLITSSGSSTDFTSSASTEADIEFNFTPPTSGSKYLWARIYSTSTNKKFAISINYSPYTQITTNTSDGWYWQMLYAIDGLQAGLAVNVRIYNVSGGYAIDEFAISDSVFDTPSGKSISWTTASTTLSGSYQAPAVTAAAVTAMSHPRIYFTSDEVSSVAAGLAAAENSEALKLHNANVARGKTTGFTGRIACAPGYSNYFASYIGVIESLALEYALKGDTEAGAKAVSASMNYIDSISYAGYSKDDLVAVGGHDIGVLSRIYDWCHDLFTAEQRNKLILKCEAISYQLSLGWPPSGLNAVTGFGAEGSLQNYLLTFAIAAADERPDIYNYIMGRMESEYIPAVSATGAGLQGTRYGTYRGQHVLTAELLMNTIGYDTNTLFGNGTEDLANWYIYARRPDGLMFADGDDTNNGKTAGKYYTVGHMRNFLVIASRLFSDPYIKNEARKATIGFSDFDYGEGYMSPASFLAINRPRLSAVSSNGHPLTRYFSSPNGCMIARTAWTDTPSVTDNAVVAYMKAGNLQAGNHQHLDAGSFQLYYKGILANDPCYYSASNYDSEYMNIYARRSVAHNTVLVRDGVSRSLNGDSAADGGQIPVDSVSTVAGLAKTATTEAYDFGGDDINQPDYSYLKADLAGAYSSSSVSDYDRSFMFLNMYDEDVPAALVVFDRLNTKNKSHQTAWLLHGLNAPSISGKRATFTLGTNGYTGKMTNDTLLPASSSITSVQDGYLTPGGTLYSSGYSGTSGVNESDGYRIEVSPSSQTTSTAFLNVVQVGEASAAMPTPALIQNDTFTGAVVKDRVALFSTSGELIGAGDANKNTTYYSFSFSSNDGYLYRFAVADAAEGTWKIEYSSDGSSYSTAGYAKTNRPDAENNGCTISFKGRAGYYRLMRVSNTHTSDTSGISNTNKLKQLSPGVKFKNNVLYVAPRTYESIQGSDTYSCKQIIAAYDGDGRFIAAKVTDFGETDKNTDYTELMTFDGKVPDRITVKTLLFEDMENVKKLATVGAAEY